MKKILLLTTAVLLSSASVYAVCNPNLPVCQCAYPEMKNGIIGCSETYCKTGTKCMPDGSCCPSEKFCGSNCCAENEICNTSTQTCEATLTCKSDEEVCSNSAGEQWCCTVGTCSTSGEKINVVKKWLVVVSEKQVFLIQHQFAVRMLILKRAKLMMSYQKILKVKQLLLNRLMAQNVVMGLCMIIVLNCIILKILDVVRLDERHRKCLMHGQSSDYGCCPKEMEGFFTKNSTKDHTRAGHGSEGYGCYDTM